MKIFCSYHFNSTKGNGFGNILLQTKEEFPLSLSEIRRFEKDIKEMTGFKNVVLLNFAELKE